MKWYDAFWTIFYIFSLVVVGVYIQCLLRLYFLQYNSRFWCRQHEQNFYCINFLIYINLHYDLRKDCGKPTRHIWQICNNLLGFFYILLISDIFSSCNKRFCSHCLRQWELFILYMFYHTKSYYDSQVERSLLIKCTSSNFASSRIYLFIKPCSHQQYLFDNFLWQELFVCMLHQNYFWFTLKLVF